MAQLAIYIDDDYYKALQTLGRKNGISVSAYARDILIGHLRSIGESPEQKDNSWRFRKGGASNDE